MSVSLRAVGSWAELTADGSVAIPATPQAGDRMYLFARWKDFSITATVANWTAVSGTPFADGAIGSGNGSGSVKVGCWYRDWQSGDTDPTIDFSSSPTNASAVIKVMQKGVDDVWLTPVARTAAMTNWTTSSQVVAASASVAVPSGGVVMGLIGIRDDTATMTRPTTGIDDSAGAITWNGNYVESPAAHHSTTTGDDGAADLGYRLVSLGATATLRMTGTISAAETGAALWIIQGVTIAVTPASASFALSTFTPVLKKSVTPTVVGFSLTTTTPLLSLSVVPNQVGLSIAPFTSLLSLSIAPDHVTLNVTSVSPILAKSISPAAQNLTISSLTSFLALIIIPDSRLLIISASDPILSLAVSPIASNFSLTTFTPFVLPFNIVWLDPGGDAVQAIGYFNTLIPGTTGASYDTSQKVAGLGSYKFDSGSGEQLEGVEVVGVLSHSAAVFSSRRVSCYFRYDSVPDSSFTVSEFVTGFNPYSGGGFGGALVDLDDDNEVYATATPAKNDGQGTVFDSLGFDIVIPIGAAIVAVKMIYDRKYDVDTSIGVSRVKYRINGIEGPDYDNTDMPLTDTVVEVDFTADRGFTRDDLLDGVFEVIAEARRGDTDTEHTQSWDYIRVEVVYRLDGIIEARDSTGVAPSFKLGLSPQGEGAVIRLIDGLGASFYGTTTLLSNTDYRISFAFIQRDSAGVNDLDINIFINGVPELSIVDISTEGVALFNLRYGWLESPGADHVCWFDQIYVDDGGDLSDPLFGIEFCPPFCTAKLPASVNENEWNTTIGTGAVNERPLSITNYKKHTATSPARQTYTLETAANGDVDISGESLLGFMSWVWAKVQSDDTDHVFFVVNGSNFDGSQIATNPSMLKRAFNSPSYPSAAAGVGMDYEGQADAFLYECGVIVAYLGPAEEVLFRYQLLMEDSETPVTDDLRADPPETYELRLDVSESDAQVEVEVYVTTFEDQEPQQRNSVFSGGGTAVVPIDNPGIEVSFVIKVVGANAYVGLRRRLNV